MTKNNKNLDSIIAGLPPPPSIAPAAPPLENEIEEEEERDYVPAGLVEAEEEDVPLSLVVRGLPPPPPGETPPLASAPLVEMSDISALPQPPPSSVEAWHAPMALPSSPLPLTPEGDMDRGAMEKAILGLKRQFAPMMLESQREAEESYSLPAIGANVAASMATYMALPKAGAAIGALAGPVGAAVGGTVGLVGAIGVGVYSALGEEYAMAMAEGREYDFKKAAVNVLVEANPIALLGKGRQALRIASQAGLQAEQARQYDAGAAGMGLAAVLGIPAAKGQAAVGREVREALEGVNTAAAVKAMSSGSARYAGADDVSDMLEEAVSSAPRIQDALAEAVEKASPKIRSQAEVLSTHAFDRVEEWKEAVKELPRTERLELTRARRDFLKWLNKNSPAPMKDNVKGAQKFLKTTGMSIEDTFEEYSFNKLRAKEFHTHVIETNIKASGEMPEAFNNPMARKLVDFAEVGQNADRITGITRTQKLAYDIGEAFNKQGDDAGAFSIKLSSLLKESRKAKFNYGEVTGEIDAIRGAALKRAQDTITKMRKESLEAGRAWEKGTGTRMRREALEGAEEQIQAVIQKLPPKHAELLNKWSSYTEELHAYGRQAGFFTEGESIVNYMPHIKVSEDVMTSRLRRTTLDALDYASENNMSLTEMAKLPQWRDYARVLEQAQGSVTDGSARRFLKQLNADPGSVQKLSEKIDTFFSFTREYAIPEFLREKDAGRAFTAYINNITRAKHLSKPLFAMKQEAGTFKALGMHETADYFDKYVRNMYGVKFAGQQSMAEANLRWKAYISKNADMMRRELSLPEKSAYYAFDMLSWMKTSVYTNLLGWTNIYAPARNLGQPQLTTATELTKLVGGDVGSVPYFHKIASKSQGKAIWESLIGGAKKGGTPLAQIDEWNKQLRKLGHAPGEYIGEGYGIMENSIRHIPGIGKAVGFVDGFNTMGMKLYAASDTVNRVVTINMAKELARDALTGNKWARQALQNVPGQQGALLRRALQRGDTEALEREAMSYLLGKTQFHYGRHGLNELGREWGSLASMFTKWPAAIVGDVSNTIKEQNYKGVIMKYFSPVLGLYLANYMVDAGIEEWGTGKEAELKKALLGQSLVAHAPMWALGGFGLPPVLDTASNIVSMGQQALMQDEVDMEKLKSTASKEVNKWIPVWGSYETAKRRWGDVIED